MLLGLKIENFALIDTLDLELGAGLNVLTGETGAGKSIILDAIDAVLGGKVLGRAVRTGKQRATIEAQFALTPDLSQWLQDQGIKSLEHPYLLCSREIDAGSARNRSRVNGIVVNKRQTEELRDRLVEITAQGQTVQLGQGSSQRAWLDSFGGKDLLSQREQVAKAYGTYQEIGQTLDRRRKAESERLQQLDLFEYQLKELQAANLDDPNEFTDLQKEHQRLNHAVELQRQSYQVYQALYQNDQGEQACADLLGLTENILSDMVEYDAQVQPILELVSNALAQVQEAGRQINTYGDCVETDPERLAEVETRMAELKQICRKYGPTLEDAIDLRERIQADLDALTGGGQSLEVLEQACTEAKAQLDQHCSHLSHLRRKAAQTLESRLVEELKPLAMEKVLFQVYLEPIEPSASGADRVTFLFSPNPGEPLQPLGEIASGGEMSRFLLALKACFSQVDPVGTLIFDEIDVGVSGRVSQTIAIKLHQLSQQHQVLCVTHQPLIAAMADRHFRVRKEILDQNRTVVYVEVLMDQEARRQELAELAGGESAQEALSFAASLLHQAADRRQSQPTETLSRASAQTPKPSRKSVQRKTTSSKRNTSSRTRKIS
jgi:DNA repair protein RecN (Recombination protein N)